MPLLICGLILELYFFWWATVPLCCCSPIVNIVQRAVCRIYSVQCYLCSVELALCKVYLFHIPETSFIFNSFAFWNWLHYYHRIWIMILLLFTINTLYKLYERTLIKQKSVCQRTTSIIINTSNRNRHKPLFLFLKRV